MDYIFGDSAAVFDNCNIFSVYNGTATGGITITAQKKQYAANSPQNYLSGYVITNSTLTNQTDLGTPTNLLYGRPWGPYSTNIFINNSVQTLNSAGWSEFTPGVTNNLPTSTYAEYGNYGPTYTTSGREPYAALLSATAAAAYAPDTFLGGSDGWSPTAALKTYIAAVVPTATSLSIAPAASVTLVARVAPPALGTPTGTLTFLDGSAILTTVTLDALGEASLTTSSLANGPHSITVRYSGDANFNPSTSSAVTILAGTATLTTLQLSTSAPIYGQSATATATVTPASGTSVPTGSVPTGSVTFSIDGSPFTPPAALASGAAAFTLPATLAAGSHTLTAVYSGDATFAGSSSSGITVTVAKAVLTVAVAGNPSRAFGQTNPAFLAAFSGFVNGDTPGSAVTGAPTLTTAATPRSNAGTYPVTVGSGTLAAANYTFNLVNGALTVTGGSAQAIFFPALANFTHGTTVPLAVTSTSGLPVSFSVTGGNASVSGNTLTITGTGTITVTASQAGNGNFAPAPSVAQTFTAQ